MRITLSDLKHCGLGCARERKSRLHPTIEVSHELRRGRIVEGEEAHAPYDRPPLSKKLLAGDPYIITLKDARKMLAAKGERFPDLLVMSFLAGRERDLQGGHRCR